MVKNFTTRRIIKPTNEDLYTITELEKHCFSSDWIYEDAYDYYKKSLCKNKTVAIFLQYNDVEIGFLIGQPLTCLYNELNVYDEKIEENQSYYLESINIVPEHRGRGGAKQLITEMCIEANKLGYNLFSTHARICNGFNMLIKNRYEKSIYQVRQIEKWVYGGSEPYEYIEW